MEPLGSDFEAVMPSVAKQNGFRQWAEREHKH